MGSSMNIIIFLSVVLKPWLCYGDNFLIVNLTKPVGTISGHTLTSAKGTTYYGFQEIPYAAPPINELRYKVPQPHPGWSGILFTTENTKACAQAEVSNLDFQNEDCLYLNVYTPVQPGKPNNLSVYVWIHGGGYAVWDGTIKRYNPKFLMDHEVIVVTLNYRLGPFGFLSTNDGAIPGNLGLRDQHMAIIWVYDNIHLFGGDPNKITIGGESAGAGAVGYHILSRFNKGKFRGAILQSGTSINTFGFVPNPSEYAFQLGRILNSSFTSNDTNELVGILQKAHYRDILAASVNVSSVDGGVGIMNDLIWAPVLEGEYKEKPFISRPMIESFMDADFNHVPILIGYNSEEIIGFLPNSTILNQEANYTDQDPVNLVNHKFNVDNADKADAGKLLKKIYTNSKFLEDPYSFIRFSSDTYFIHGLIRFAQLLSNYSKAYLYQFSYVAQSTSEFPGAKHTEELQYLWYKDDDGDDVNDFQPTIRNRMLKLWTNFIKYQNPTPEKEKDLNNTVWSPVTPNSINMLDINENLQVIKNTNPRHYYEVRKIWNKSVRPPFNVC